MPVDANRTDSFRGVPPAAVHQDSREETIVVAGVVEAGAPPCQTTAVSRPRQRRRTGSELFMHVMLFCLSLGLLIVSRSLALRDPPAIVAGQESRSRSLPTMPTPAYPLKDPRRCGEVVVPLLEIPLPASCAFRGLTGIPCPGCGLTRSFVSLAHGQWRAAWSYNPAGWFFFAIVLFQLPYRACQMIRIGRGRQPLQVRRAGQCVAWGLLLVLLLQWLASLLV
jgi:hypothetical protein